MPRTERSTINQANALRQSDGFWTAERIAVLKSGSERKLSARAIAAEIGGRCTKSMVIAKAGRLHIPLNKPPGADPVARAAAERQRRIDRLRGQCARLLAQIIALSAEGTIRVSRETEDASA